MDVLSTVVQQIKGLSEQEIADMIRASPHAAKVDANVMAQALVALADTTE